MFHASSSSPIQVKSAPSTGTQHKLRKKKIKDPLLEFPPLAVQISFSQAQPFLHKVCVEVPTNSWIPPLSAHNPLTHITVHLATVGNRGRLFPGYLTPFRFQSCMFNSFHLATAPASKWTECMGSKWVSPKHSSTLNPAVVESQNF